MWVLGRVNDGRIEFLDDLFLQSHKKCNRKDLHPEKTLRRSSLQSTLSSEEQTGRRITQQIHPSSLAVKRKDETSANKAVFSSLQFTCRLSHLCQIPQHPFPWACGAVIYWNASPANFITTAARSAIPREGQSLESLTGDLNTAQNVCGAYYYRDAESWGCRCYGSDSIWCVTYFHSWCEAKDRLNVNEVMPNMAESEREETWKTVFVNPLLSFLYATLGED